MNELSGQKTRGMYCHDLVSRLTERRLLKEVFDAPISDLPEACRTQLNEISKPKNRKKRREVEDQIAKSIRDAGITFDSSLPCPDRLVIVQDYSLKSVREQSRNDEGLIMIAEDSPIPFEEASQLFHSIDEKLTMPHFAVYAPVSYDNPSEKKRLCERAKKAIIASLEGMGDGT